jgi:hypothetical protein
MHLEHESWTAALGPNRDNYVMKRPCSELVLAARSSERASLSHESTGTRIWQIMQFHSVHFRNQTNIVPPDSAIVTQDVGQDAFHH